MHENGAGLEALEYFQTSPIYMFLSTGCFAFADIRAGQHLEGCVELTCDLLRCEMGAICLGWCY